MITSRTLKTLKIHYYVPKTRPFHSYKLKQPRYQSTLSFIIITFYFHNQQPRDHATTTTTSSNTQYRRRRQRIPSDFVVLSLLLLLLLLLFTFCFHSIFLSWTFLSARVCVCVCAIWLRRVRAHVTCIPSYLVASLACVYACVTITVQQLSGTSKRLCAVLYSCASARAYVRIYPYTLRYMRFFSRTNKLNLWNKVTFAVSLLATLFVKEYFRNICLKLHSIFPLQQQQHI